MEEALWEVVLDALRCRMDKQTFSYLLAGSRLAAADGDRWTVEVRSSAAVEWLTHRLAGLAGEAATQEAGRPVEVVFVPPDEACGGAEAAAPAQAARRAGPEARQDRSCAPGPELPCLPETTKRKDGREGATRVATTGRAPCAASSPHERNTMQDRRRSQRSPAGDPSDAGQLAAGNSRPSRGASEAGPLDPSPEACSGGKGQGRRSRRPNRSGPAAGEPAPFDPSEAGWTRLANYNLTFWWELLGVTAANVWLVIRSRDVRPVGPEGWTPEETLSVSRLARAAADGDRGAIAGRRRVCGAMEAGEPGERCRQCDRKRSLDEAGACRYLLPGALVVLEREGLVVVRRLGEGKQTSYRVRVVRTLPLLAPRQAARLAAETRRLHEQWLRRHGVDVARWERVTAASLAPEG